MVHSPSTWAITMSPLFGAWPLSTITMSPGMMPAPVMESPATFRRKVASRFWIRKSSSERVSTSSSSAGEGKPASTVPRTFTARPRERGTSLPVRSRARTFISSSRAMSLKTAFLDRRPVSPAISA